MHSIIYKFPDNFRVFPAHDYAGRTVSTIGEEKRFNPRLTKPLSEFIKIMKNLNLPPPNMIGMFFYYLCIICIIYVMYYIYFIRIKSRSVKTINFKVEEKAGL